MHGSKLLKLAHENKREAFRLYSQHYLSTDGAGTGRTRCSCPPTFQSYAEFLESSRPQEASPRVRETLVIGRTLRCLRQSCWIHAARGKSCGYMAQRSSMERSAHRRDTTSFLPWARRLRVRDFQFAHRARCSRHCARTAAAFRALTDANSAGRQLFRPITASPRRRKWKPHIRSFARGWPRRKPRVVFFSNWYAHYRAAFGAARPAELPMVSAR